MKVLIRPKRNPIMETGNLWWKHNRKCQTVNIMNTHSLVKACKSNKDNNFHLTKSHRPGLKSNNEQLWWLGIQELNQNCIKKIRSIIDKTNSPSDEEYQTAWTYKISWSWSRSEFYVASSREYMRSSYITWRAEIGCRVGEVAVPVSCWTKVCNPGSVSILGSIQATQAAKYLPQGEKWAPISLQI